MNCELNFNAFYGHLAILLLHFLHEMAMPFQSSYYFNPLHTFNNIFAAIAIPFVYACLCVRVLVDNKGQSEVKRMKHQVS